MYSNGNGDRYYIRYVQTPSQGVTSEHVIGYSKTDPDSRKFRMIDLEPYTALQRKRSNVEPSTQQTKRRTAAKAPNDTLFNSLSHLERTFRSDASKHHMLKPFDVPDQTPFGLALLGTAVFEPLFRTFRTLFQNRRAAFRYTANEIKEELPALSLEELTSLENECQQLWRAVHTSMLKKHEAS